MLIPGLVSVTFRNKTAREVCALCEKADIRAIEWGGDIHVPPGGRFAHEVRKMSRDFGLAVCAYGSYYRVGRSLDDFERNLDAASELGAPAIRVWLGESGSRETNGDARVALIDALAMLCEKAGNRGLVVAPEFHGGTLTDEVKSVAQLMDETRGMEHLRFYWQPRWDWPEADRLRALKIVQPRLLDVHAFTWRHENGIERLPLADGGPMWNKVLAQLSDAHILLEFVCGDDEQVFLRDAMTLKNWIG